MPRSHRSTTEWPVPKPEGVDEKAEAVQVSSLGGFRLSVESRAIEESEWRLKKAQSLVKLLALTSGHRLHRGRMMELLWPKGLGRRG